MGDLAQAIVDLGRHAEKRRDSRRRLRESGGVVITELLRHLRAGDEAWVYGKENGRDPEVDSRRMDACYRVERVWWQLEPKVFGMPALDDPIRSPFECPRPANTLVGYFLPTREFADLAGDENLMAMISTGAVLHDVRKPWTDDSGTVYPIAGSSMYTKGSGHVLMGGEPPRLYLATDDDLVRFAEDALAATEQFRGDLGAEATRFEAAADAITRLAPR